jgi:hypothetical protein
MIDSTEIKKVMVSAYPFLGLDWIPVVKDGWWYDGTELIVCMKLDGGKWLFETLTIMCDDNRFELVDEEGNHYGAYDLNDFDYMAIQSGGLAKDHGEAEYIDEPISSLHMQ